MGKKFDFGLKRPPAPLSPEEQAKLDRFVTAEPLPLPGVESSSQMDTRPTGHSDGQPASPPADQTSGHPASQTSSQPAAPKKKGIRTLSGGVEKRRLTVYLPPVLARQLERTCLDQDLDLSTAVQEAVEAWLQGRG